MKSFISILLSSILLTVDCSQIPYYYDYYIQNDSDELIYLFEGENHASFCVHENRLREVEKKSTFISGVPIIDGEAYTYYIYVFKKSTLEKYSVEEIERKRIHDGFYIVNATDCKEGINNRFVYKGD